MKVKGRTVFRALVGQSGWFGRGSIRQEAIMKSHTNALAVSKKNLSSGALKAKLETLVVISLNLIGALNIVGVA
jgi:hypothetical protein